MSNASHVKFVSITPFTVLYLASSQQAILTRCGFLGSTVTALHCHAELSCSVRISSSTTLQIAPAEIWSLASFSTLEVSMVQ
jgi:hypothetical protein